MTRRELREAALDPDRQSGDRLTIALVYLADSMGTQLADIGPALEKGLGAISVELGGIGIALAD